MSFRRFRVVGGSLFFFSSRRRHTIYWRDWSSDVCSSDLSEPGQPPLPAAGMAQVGMAEVLYERDGLGAALEHATAGVALCRPLAYTPPLATGLVTLARIRHAQDDQQGTLDALEEADGAMPDPAMVDLLNPVPTQRARLLLADGDPTEALRLVRQRGLGADDQEIGRASCRERV